MTNPPGMRVRAFKLTHTGQLQVYSDEQHLFLQLRRSTPTEEDVLTPSFKVAAQLTFSEALAVAGEPLTWAAQQTEHGERKITDPSREENVL